MSATSFSYFSWPILRVFFVAVSTTGGMFVRSFSLCHTTVPFELWRLACGANQLGKWCKLAHLGFRFLGICKILVLHLYVSAFA